MMRGGGNPSLPRANEPEQTRPTAPVPENPSPPSANEPLLPSDAAPPQPSAPSANEPEHETG